MSATQLRKAPSKEDKIEEEQKTSIDTLKLQESRSVSLHTVNLPRGMSSASEMKEEEEEKQTELIPERAGKDEKSAPIETIAPSSALAPPAGENASDDGAKKLEVENHHHHKKADDEETTDGMT